MDRWLKLFYYYSQSKWKHICFTYSKNYKNKSKDISIIPFLIINNIKSITIDGENGERNRSIDVQVFKGSLCVPLLNHSTDSLSHGCVSRRFKLFECRKMNGICIFQKKKNTHIRKFSHSHTFDLVHHECDKKYFFFNFFFSISISFIWLSMHSIKQYNHNQHTKCTVTFGWKLCWCQSSVRKSVEQRHCWLNTKNQTKNKIRKNSIHISCLLSMSE